MSLIHIIPLTPPDTQTPIITAIPQAQLTERKEVRGSIIYWATDPSPMTCNKSLLMSFHLSSGVCLSFKKVLYLSFFTHNQHKCAKEFSEKFAKKRFNCFAFLTQKILHILNVSFAQNHFKRRYRRFVYLFCFLRAYVTTIWRYLFRSYLFRNIYC